MFDVFCNFCKKKGHLRSNCRALQKPQLKESIKPTGVTHNRPYSHKSSVKNNVVVEVTKSQPGSVMEIYEPFISEGTISFIDDSTKPIRIKILRDTGASRVSYWLMFCLSLRRPIRVLVFFTGNRVRLYECPSS